jgi:hypothetical protein
MTTSRNIAAVAVGYLVFALSAVALFQLSGERPHAPASSLFMAVCAAYGMMFAGLGGWLAAAVSTRRPMLHGSLVAILIAIGAIMSLLFSASQAHWSQWEALILMAPMAVVGASVRVSMASHSKGA